METNQKVVRMRSLPTLRGIFSYVENLKSEFKKIQWTEGKEVWEYAKVVVIATFALGFGIYIVDVTIQKLLSILETVFVWLFG